MTKLIIKAQERTFRGKENDLNQNPVEDVIVECTQHNSKLIDTVR